MIEWTLRRARRVVIAVIGATLVAIGVAMLVLPGPGLLVIGLGLAALSTEFVWARRWLSRVKEAAKNNGLLGEERSAETPRDER